jgi:hypothetical protein
MLLLLPLPPVLTLPPPVLVRDGGAEPVAVPLVLALELAGADEAAWLVLLVVLLCDDTELCAVDVEEVGGRTAGGGGPWAVTDVASAKRAKPLSRVLVSPLMLGARRVLLLLRGRAVSAWNERISPTSQRWERGC